MNDLIEALQIFRKYGNPENPTNCSHDELFVDINPDLVSLEDTAKLDDLGFFVGEEYEEGFSSSRFGSC